jgi:3-dehydroquinate dehydratase-1
MRLESPVKVTVRHAVVGGPRPLVCLPLVAGEQTDLLDQAEDLIRLKPDLLEWRVDAWNAIEDAAGIQAALSALRTAMGELPLIFTCRIHTEGGFNEIAQQVRLDMITAAVSSGQVDIVDVEMCNPPDFLQAVTTAAHDTGTRLILSRHNFESTPDEAVIVDMLSQAQQMGADIAKIAVMPGNYSDVLTLLNATLKARTGSVRIPMVAISMGARGRLTRVAGGLFGSDITYAVGRDASAPGQITIHELKQAMALVYD